MRRAARRLLCGALAAGMVFAAGTTVSAATSHYADGTTSSNWAAWPEQWETIRKNYETVSLTPGRTASELNFAWYSKTGAAATPVVKLATKSDMSDARTFRGTTMNAISGYVSNRVTATGLKENTTYYYTYLNNGKESSPAQYRTRSFSQYKILFVGDPQIGASKGQTTSLGDKLESDTDVNTAARNDAFNWNVSLNTALKANPDISFMISAGDQINKNVDGT
ncbi:MAG TPA: serine/threonine protein phosphatase, partial [Ruminococcaceae bacterium]|nr:serine/threonine protein phosphatase [Oscillospiraceae bacterium]